MADKVSVVAVEGVVCPFPRELGGEPGRYIGYRRATKAEKQAVAEGTLAFDYEVPGGFAYMRRAEPETLQKTHEVARALRQGAIRESSSKPSAPRQVRRALKPEIVGEE